MSATSLSRRWFLRAASLAAAATALPKSGVSANWLAAGQTNAPLAEFGYGAVTLVGDLHESQLANTQAVLLQLNEDSLLRPFRQMAGLPAPGTDLGGWYQYNPDYDYHKDSVGLAPGATFGQWVSALARMHAISGSPASRDKVLRLNRLYAQAISGGFFEKNRFPAYSYDKLVCGLIDAHQFAADPNAFDILKQTTQLALPHLPETAIEREHPWRPGKDISYNWDESYTLPENLFLAAQRGAGGQYRELAIRYLHDASYFDPLAEGRNVLSGKHAYSYVNALNSAMLAYMTLGSEKHLRAAQNGFDMLAAQSFATGGWGPDELLRAPGSGEVAASLTKTHNSFETPCGSYVHFKLTRYLLRVTGDSRYGDSMERVMYNTVLGATPLEPDGKAFYYSDYNFDGHKVYSSNIWPCCSGTLPQVAADYRINTYFRDGRGLYVNLYIPSTVRWQAGGAAAELTQTGTYPFDELVQLEMKVTRPAEFALNLRIPAWTDKASVDVNGKNSQATLTPGTFATIRREWRSGDRIELHLPMKMRLESIDGEHRDTVALLRGPLVLFAATQEAPRVSRQQLLAARRIGAQQWQVDSPSGPVTMLPFVSISGQRYSTYLRVS